MHLGHSCMIGSADIRVDRLAVELETRGFESLWLGEHGHLPVASAIPADHQGSTPNAEPLTPPDPYRRMPDPVVSFAVASAVTTHLRLGFGVLLALERHPLTAAKEIATLDQLSDGRVIVGVGVGWNRLELANHLPIPWSLRYRAIEEYVALLRSLWRDDEVEFHGEFFEFEPLWSYPKPTQNPGPPVLFGGVGPRAITHAARWADGWLPADDRLGDVSEGIARFRRAVAEAGRDPNSVPITLNVRLSRDSDGRLPSHDLLKRYRDLGVQRVVLIDVSADVMPPDERLRMLDDYAALIPALDS